LANDYLKNTSPELWSLNGFVDWCNSCDLLKGDKAKILDHIKKGLEKVKNNALIQEDTRQKATKLCEDFQTWKSSQTTTKYFQQLEIRYRTEQELEAIESRKTIDFAEIDRMKVSQLRSNTESVTKIHQCVSDGLVEFSKENTMQKRTLESDRRSNSYKNQEPSALEDLKKLENPKKRPADEAFTIITPPPNLRDCSPPPSYKSGDNSFTTEASTEASPSSSNSYDESDTGIYEDVDENPFITKNGEESRNNKFNDHDKSKKDIYCSGLTQTDVEIEGLDDDGQMSASDYEPFRQKYNSMETSKKWLLSTGITVEDKLFDFGLKCTREHLSHSFILDPDDENYLKEGIFTESELAEIRNFQTKPFPIMSKELLTYLNSFRPRTTAELRRLVFRQEAMDQNFDRQKDFDRDWIRNTVYNLLREYEANSLKKDHLELWLLLHIWGFIDKAFENLEDVEAVRGESCSFASSERKNKKRTVSALIKIKRKILGRKGDLIIRKIFLEYGCSEAGMFYKGKNDTKLLRERGLKTPKMMKDMFYHLCESVDWVEQKIRKMETIGFLHAGLMMMMLRLDSPSGYICRISRSKSLNIPSQVEEFGAKALPCILLAWMAKTIVANVIRLVEQEDENNVNEEDQLQQLLNSCEASNIISSLLPKRAETHLSHFPGNSNTPEKKQRALLFGLDKLGPPIPFKLMQKK
ncbi:17518_t:CDS:10, partial [Cetraspora pellucida]